MEDLKAEYDEAISIHALRVEGDKVVVHDDITLAISIHALRVEGDRSTTSGICAARDFYPRPPGGGRHYDVCPECAKKIISIHALRVEGDRKPGSGLLHKRHFYPRPPGGGRRWYHNNFIRFLIFLSTPSGWRATQLSRDCYHCALAFLSTPSGWRATLRVLAHVKSCPAISIHALRVEGDKAKRRN